MQMNTKVKLNTYDHVHPSAFIRNVPDSHPVQLKCAERSSNISHNRYFNSKTVQ